MNLKIKNLFKSLFLKKNGHFIDLPKISGLSMSSCNANLYKRLDRNDISIFYFKDGANHAGVYTKSHFK